MNPCTGGTCNYKFRKSACASSCCDVSQALGVVGHWCYPRVDHFFLVPVLPSCVPPMTISCLHFSCSVLTCGSPSDIPSSRPSSSPALPSDVHSFRLPVVTLFHVLLQYYVRTSSTSTHAVSGMDSLVYSSVVQFSLVSCSLV